MDICGFQVLFLLVSQCSGFISVCPHVSHAKIKEKTCEPETPKFMCFRDINEHVFKEMCRKTEEYQPEGLKIVVSGNLDGVPCDDKHFQPFTYSSSHGDTCVFLKSSCNEEGQIVSDDGLTKSDRTCLCDYRFGYTFVSRPRSTCFCVPSKEDCSCYYKKCENDQVLSPDYYCIDRDNITVNFRCPWISESNSKKSTETKMKNVIKSTDEDSCPQRTLVDAMRTQAVVIVIVIPLGLIYLLIIRSLVRYIGHNCNVNCQPKVEVVRSSYIVNYGCTVTLQCNVASSLDWKTGWRKLTCDNHVINISTGNNYCECKSTDTASLKITSATLEDSGNYSCMVKNDVGSVCSQAIKLIVSGDSPKLTVQTNEPCTEIGSGIELACKIYANPPLIGVEWKKYENGSYAAMGGNVFVKNKDTTISTLMLNRVTKWHAGTYFCFATNAIGKAQSLPVTLGISEGYDDTQRRKETSFFPVPVEKSSIKPFYRTYNQITVCGLYQRSISLPPLLSSHRYEVLNGTYF